MCGIVGYVGRREAEPLLLEGLRRLEYRGYDSAGLATVAGRKLHVRKRAGRVAGRGDAAVVVVHNGVIENYAALKRQLQAEGVAFASDTDTEVIAHLIARHLNGDLAEAVNQVLPLLKGTYGLAAL